MILFYSIHCLHCRMLLETISRHDTEKIVKLACIEDIKAKRNKIRYWIAEEGLEYLQNLILYLPNGFRKLVTYINYRWVLDTHLLAGDKKHLKRGRWHDFDSKFLPCLFDGLVDFVEIECAIFHEGINKQTRKKYKKPWWTKFYYKWRSKEAGLDYLKWSSNNSDDTYAQAIREILTLYFWWTEKRPQRETPESLSDYEEVSEIISEKTLSEKALISSLIDNYHTINKRYQNEDEEMMIRLIKIRNYLWT